MPSNHMRSSSANSSHIPCPVPGCPNDRERGTPLCASHWDEAPAQLKAICNTAFARFQESPGTSTEKTNLRRDYLRALTACVDAVKG
jgi:hypothetical protein